MTFLSLENIFYFILLLMPVSYEPSSRTDANMSPLKSKAAKEFGTPRPSLPPPERKGHPGELYFFHSKKNSKSFSDIVIFVTNIAGKSSPMMEVFSSFSMVGVYETLKGLKFVHITSEVKCLPVMSLIILLSFSASEVYRQVHHLDLHGQEVLQRIKLGRPLSQSSQTDRT